MRFRVPNTGGQQAADGIGNFFRAMAMAPLHEAQAAEEAQTAGMKRDLIGAQTEHERANIGKVLAEAAIKAAEAKTLEGRPDVLNLMGATRAGMSVPEFQAGVNERKYGAPAVGPALLPQPIEGVGPSGRTAAFDDAILTLFGPAMATPADKTNWDQIANARGEYQDQGLAQDAAAAAKSGNYMGSSALSAVRGKKEFTPFKAVGNTGTALNEITGDQPVSNTGLNVLFNNEGKALIGQRDAAAGASRAAAGASGALAGLRGVQTTNEKIEGGMKALDYNAAKSGQPLPSSNKGTSGASSTNAKFRNQVILAAMRTDQYKMLDPAEKQAFIDEELAVAGMEPVRPGEVASVAGATPPAGAGKPAGKQIDMDAANKVKADFKAGRITKEQAKAKLKALGMD